MAMFLLLQVGGLGYSDKKSHSVSSAGYVGSRRCVLVNLLYLTHTPSGAKQSKFSVYVP
jgi:hypothetical protein